jgi:hypothetical protein
MTDEVASAVASVVGTGVVGMVPIDRGHLANRRYRAQLDDGTSVFVKEPTSPFTENVLADEHRAYAAIGRRSFLPAYLGGDRILVVEDLTHAYWPPPWRSGDLAAVDELLGLIGEVPGPGTLRDLNADTRHHVWSKVANDPAGFLSLGVCDLEWFEAALDILVASDECPLGGTALVHGDFRSDNLCILDGKAVAVDWGAGARGRPDYDRIGFAIALASEAGARPEELAPQADPLLVSVFAGTYAYAAALPIIPAPIRLQLHDHLRVALPWCARLAQLPPPRPTRV